ncbi:MAG TPA: hypothetical protein VH186_00160 [Chloroflexia bacterium]|nr:hypothetical protein [Chloroflexia bacterium]
MSPRLDWATARFRGGHTEIEVISLGVIGNLGYTIWIEKGDALLEGFDDLKLTYLRDTHLYRQEDGSGKSFTGTLTQSSFVFVSSGQ